MKQVTARIFAQFIYSALTVVGSAAILGGWPVWKAAVAAGVSATLPVVAVLARAYAAKGYVTPKEVNDALDQDA